MALNKLKFNSLNVTPTAGKTIGFNSSANGLEATFSGGAMTVIKKLTASSSSTLSMVDGSSDVVLDSTYKEYLFLFNNIHPSANGNNFTFQCSTDSGSNYNTTVTNSAFQAYHKEDGSDNTFGINSSVDNAQATSFIRLVSGAQLGDGADESLSGYLHLFKPSSTTFVKHWHAVTNFYDNNHAYTVNAYTAGYFNTASAIDAIQFKMDSGNIDAGTITLYGIN